MGSKRRQRGFTLLEVLVALSITGISLGVVFSLLAESKRLAANATQRLHGITLTRAALHAAHLQNEPEKPLMIDLGTAQLLIAGEIIPPPERQTRELTFAAERTEVVTASDRITAIRILLLPKGRP